MKKYHKYIILTFTTLQVALFTSCSSQRRATTPQRAPRPVEVPSRPPGYVFTPMHPSTEAQRRLVEVARSWIGVPYRYGGIARDGVDCSGLVFNIYREALGIELPRNSSAQRAGTAEIDRHQLQPGDLVFFTSKNSGNGISHVGLYVDPERMIHASSSRGVIESRLDEPYWVLHYHSAGRVSLLADSTHTATPTVIAPPPPTVVTVDEPIILQGTFD